MINLVNIKYATYLGILIVSLLGARWGFVAIHDAGFNAAVVQQKELIQDAREQATEDARIKWQKLVDEAEGQIIVEDRIVEVIREVEVEIPTVVERIVEVHPECNDLGLEFAGLLNKQVNAGNSGETGSTDIPAEPD